MRQLSAKDQLSKHYQVPIFKFIGKDNRVSREQVHAGKFSCLVCPMHVLLCANGPAITNTVCVLRGVPTLPCANVWAGTRTISLYTGLLKAFEERSLDLPTPRATLNVKWTHLYTARSMRPHVYEISYPQRHLQDTLLYYKTSIRHTVSAVILHL